MKRKDIIQIIVAVIIIIVVVVLIYNIFAPPAKDTGITVEVPKKITPSYNTDQINGLTSNLTGGKLKDFTQDITPNFGDKSKVF